MSTRRRFWPVLVLPGLIGTTFRADALGRAAGADKDAGQVHGVRARRQ